MKIIGKTRTAPTKMAPIDSDIITDSKMITSLKCPILISMRPPNVESLTKILTSPSANIDFTSFARFAYLCRIYMETQIRSELQYSKEVRNPSHVVQRSDSHSSRSSSHDSIGNRSLSNSDHKNENSRHKEIMMKCIPKCTPKVHNQISHEISSWSDRPPSSDEAPSSKPSIIYAVYDDSLDIVRIHDTIRSKFCFKIANLENLEIKIADLRSKIQKNKMTLISKNRILKKITCLKTKIMSLRSLVDWHEYLKQARPLLDLYLKIRSIDCVEDLTMECTTVIHRYVRIASQYIHINIAPITQSRSKCPLCGDLLENSVLSDDHGTYVCRCGRETIGITKAATFRDSARVDTGMKNSYQDLNNFVKRIDAFEGKQRTKPPKKLYDQLREYFVKNPILVHGVVRTCDQIKACKPNKRGKKSGTSTALLSDALYDTQNTAFYRDIELIAHELWGWRLADLSSNGLKAQIVKDYIETQKVYEVIKTRESSLNVNIRLYLHLKARDFDCDLVDFRTISATGSLKYHQKKWKQMCKETGLKFTKII